MKKVAILQEYVPEYRRPFFEELTRLAACSNIDLTIATGVAAKSQLKRGDTAPLLSGQRLLQQSEFKLGKRRLVIRKTGVLFQNMDLVILEQARRNLDAYRLLLPRRLRNARIAFWGHGRDYVAKKSRMERVLFSALTRRSDWFFSYTDGGRRALETNGYNSKRITVVLNSTDTASLQQDVRSVRDRGTEHVKQKLGLQGFVVLHMGALDKSKRLDFLVEAIKLVKESIPDLTLVFAGSGPELPYLESVMAKDGNDWIRHLGTVAGAAKAEALAVADILCLPGRIGLVAVDSFAAAVPIVTTDWPWHAPEFEYLHDHCNARITENNVAQYADVIIELLNNSIALAALSAGAANSASEYSIATMAERYLSGIVTALDSGAAE